jgi:hypothetical protein
MGDMKTTVSPVRLPVVAEMPNGDFRLAWAPPEIMARLRAGSVENLEYRLVKLETERDFTSLDESLRNTDAADSGAL